MEVSSGPIHSLAGEDTFPSRKKSAEPQEVRTRFEHPDPHPDEACLLEHHSYVPPKSSSNGVTFINLLKSNIGAGFLALPYAFYNIGLVGGCLILPAIVAVAIAGMRLLVSVKARLRDSEFRTKSDAELTYPAIALSLLGRCGQVVVIIALFVSQLGTCCAYLIFWGNTFDNYGGIPRWGAILIAGAVVFPLTTFTNPRALRWSSFLWLALGVIALFALYGYNIAMASESPTTDTPKTWKEFSTNVEKFPRFFGISTFAMEGITVVLPLEQSARHKAKFPGLMISAMLFCGIVFGTFGALGYAVFGDKTHQSVLKNLPDDSAYVSILEVVIAINLLCTLPVQLFPISEIIDQWVLGPTTAPRRWCLVVQLRLVLVALIMGVAMLVHDFGDTLSIVGGFSFMIIGVVVPIMMHIAQTKHEMSLGVLIGLIVLLGQAISICLLVTGMSLYNLWVDG